MPYRLLDPSVAEPAPIVEIGLPNTLVGETLATIREEVFEETGKRTNLPNDSGGKLDKCINWAYRQMMSSIKLKECYASFLIELVVGQPFYLLPVQCASIRSVSLIDATAPNGGAKLLSIDENQYTRLPDLDDTPRNYFRYGRGGSSMLVLYGDPDEVLSLAVDCRIRVDDLTDDTDSPILPVEFHDGLIQLSKYRAFKSVEDYTKAAQSKNDYLDAIGSLLNTDADEDAELPSGIQFIKDPRSLTRIPTRNKLWPREFEG